MTVPLQTRRSPLHLGNGVADSFAFSFKVFSSADVAVTTADAAGVETERALNTDYTVSVNADQDATPGGTITYPISGTKLQTGEKLVIVGVTAATQLTDLQSYGFYPQSVEDMVDRLTMILQQLQDTAARTAVLADTTAEASLAFPSPESDKLIAWNTAGDALVNKAFMSITGGIVVSSFAETLLDDPDAATARGTLLAAAAADLATTNAGLLTQATTAFTTGGTSGAYALTTTYGALVTGERFRAKFHTAGPSTGISTLDRDTLGAKALKRYDTSGAKIDANITANLLTDIEYDGTDYVVLTPLDLPHGKTRYTTSGTWTAPAGVTTAWLTGCGPGGGGAGGNSATVGGGGGGGGQSVIAEAVTVVPGTSYTVTIGTGGAGSVIAAANGSAGSGATVFGSTLLSLAAGAGGTVSGVGGAAGGAGGSAQGGAAGVSGSDNPVGGTGGSSMFGAGGAGGTSVTSPRTGSGYGSGGGGGVQSALGAAGSNGFLLVEW